MRRRRNIYSGILSGLLLLRLAGWRVDPHRFRYRSRLWSSQWESRRVEVVRGTEHLVTIFQNRLPTTVMQAGWRQQPDSCVVMLYVVPFEESPAERQCRFKALEPIREFRSVFQRLELAFRERIVVRYMGPAVRFGHAEGCQQLRYLLGFHRWPPVAVQRQFVLPQAVP